MSREVCDPITLTWAPLLARPPARTSPGHSRTQPAQTPWGTATNWNSAAEPRAPLRTPIPAGSPARPHAAPRGEPRRGSHGGAEGRGEHFLTRIVHAPRPPVGEEVGVRPAAVVLPFLASPAPAAPAALAALAAPAPAPPGPAAPPVPTAPGDTAPQPAAAARAPPAAAPVAPATKATAPFSCSSPLLLARLFLRPPLLFLGLGISPARSRGSWCPAPTEAAPRGARAAVESAGPAALLRHPPRRAARAAPSWPPRPPRFPGAGAGGHARPPEARSRASATGPRAERDAREPEGKGGSRACFDSAALTRSGPAPARDDTGAQARPRPPGDLTAGRPAPATSRPDHCPPPGDVIQAPWGRGRGGELPCSPSVPTAVSETCRVECWWSGDLVTFLELGVTTRSGKINR